MTISVIVPTYNRSEMVVEAVRSALAQAPPPLEVLVCDCASTDDTAARIDGFGDPRVRLLRLARNTGGPAAPRNLGIRSARGEWCAFLDDDDRWMPEKLTRQAAWFEEADVIASNARRRSTGASYFPAAPNPSALARDNVLITSSTIIRTALLRDVGGFPEAALWQGIEDYVTWLALTDRGARVRILDDVLVDYRDEGSDRFGTKETRRVHRQLAALHAWRWAHRPLAVARARTAVGAAVTWVRG